MSCGVTWTTQAASQVHPLYGVTWSGNQFVAVGDAGTIRTSTDGSTWTSNIQGSSHTSVVWSGSQFVAVGQSGQIFTSPNGGTWTSQSSGVPNTLTDIAWSGSQFVVVGDTGTILTSPTGTTWTSQTSSTLQLLTSIVWSGSQFVAVGGSGTILTSPNGSTWTSQTSGTANNLSDIAWSGSQFVVVGESGTILTSPDGITWTPQTSGLTHPLMGITWSGDQFVAVGFDGSDYNSTTILTSDCPWGDNFTLTANRWTMIGLPAAPTNNTVNDLFGATLTGTYGDGADWEVWQRLYSPVRYDLLDLTDPMALGTGYWIRSTTGATVSLSAASAPVLTHPAGCPSTVGCYAISLDTAQAGYKLVGFPPPYPIGWWDVRVVVNGTTSYTLDSAETNDFLASTYWAYNGTGTGGSGSYEVYDDLTPGMIGMPLPWQGWWVKVLDSGVGQTITLLIPAIPKVSQAPAPKSGLERVLEMVFPSAQAAPPDFAPANG